MKALLLATLLIPTVAQATSLSAGLSLQASTLIADAAQQAAQAQGRSIVISLHDAHGNLKYFRRMDATASGSVQVAQLKAATSAGFPVDSDVLAQRSAALPANPYGAVPGFLLLEGGLPIFDKQGQHLGGIGISGATPELDRAFAEAGLAAYSACAEC